MDHKIAGMDEEGLRKDKPKDDLACKLERAIMK